MMRSRSIPSRGFRVPAAALGVLAGVCLGGASGLASAPGLAGAPNLPGAPGLAGAPTLPGAPGLAVAWPRAGGNDEASYFTVRPRFREGDRATRESWVTMDLDLSLARPGDAAGEEGGAAGEEGGAAGEERGSAGEEGEDAIETRFRVEVEASRRETLEIAAAPEGTIREIQRDVEEASLVEHVSIGDERREHELDPPVPEGRAVIEIEGDRAEIRPEGGGGDAREEIDARLLPDASLVFLPRAPRREEGDGWRIDPELAAAFVSRTLDPAGRIENVRVTSAEATLDEVGEDGDRTVATVTVEMSCEADLELDLGWGGEALADLPSARWTAELDATLRFDLDRGVPLEVSVDGAVTVDPGEGRGGEGAAASSLEGEGEIRYTAKFELDREAEDTVAITYRDYEGLPVEKADDFTMDMEMTMNLELPQLPGGPPPGAEDIDMTMRAEHSSRQRRTVLAAEDGKATKVRLEILEGSSSMQMEMPAMGGGGMEPTEEEDPLVGEVVEIEKDGEDVAVSLEGGGDVPDEARSGYRLEPDLHEFLPEGPVAIGDSWAIDVQEFARQILPMAELEADSPLASILEGIEGQIECTLEGTEILDGVRCARIALGIDIAADLDMAEIMEAVREKAEGDEEMGGMMAELPPLEGGGEVSIDLSGFFFVALDEERPVRMEFEGKMVVDLDMSLEIEGQDASFGMHMSGEGEMMSRSDYRIVEDV